MDDSTVTLHYVDKLHGSLIETGKSINRSMMLEVVLALGVLAMATGIVTTNQKFSVTGLELQFEAWVFPLAGSWLLALVYVYLLELTVHENELRDTILRLYSDLGISDKSLKDLETNPLESPNIITVVVSKERVGSTKYGLLMRIYAALVMVSVLLVLPILAEIVAAYNLFKKYGVNWWFIVSYVAIFVLMFLYLMVIAPKFSK